MDLETKSPPPTAPHHTHTPPLPPYPHHALKHNTHSSHILQDASIQTDLLDNSTTLTPSFTLSILTI